MEITVKEGSTGYIIPKIKNFRFYGVENFFTSFNSRTKERDPFGIIETEEFIRIPKIDIEHLGRLLRVNFQIEKLPCTPHNKLGIKMVMKNQPKNEIQAEVIKNTIDSFNEGHHRVVISLPTGQGKTYVATNVISQLNTPTFIFVKSTNLRDQWVESFYRHSNIKNIAVITGSSDLMSVLESGIKYDVIISTHRSVQNFIDLVGFRDFNRMLILQGIGLKVFDEFDLEADSTFKLETHTFVNKTLYLSATDYKSPNCDKVFQAVYGHLPNFGKEYDIRVPRNALFIKYKSRPSKREYAKCHTFTRDGFTFDYHKYHAYIVESGAYKPGLEYVWEKLIKNRFYNKEEYLKTVFFIGRKVTAERFKRELSEISGVPMKSIAILNSDTPDKDREKYMKYKLIVSTADSMGRGIDLKGLDIVVDFETRASLSKTTQVVGRVSRTGMKNVGTYIQFVDESFPTVVRNYTYKVESGFYEKMFTNMYEKEITKSHKKESDNHGNR